MGLPLEVVGPLYGGTRGHTGTGDSQLAHLGLARVSLLCVIRHQYVIGLLWLECVVCLDSEGRVVHKEGKLGWMDEDVLERDVDARASSDGEGPLWFGCEAVAKEGNIVVTS